MNLLFYIVIICLSGFYLAYSQIITAPMGILKTLSWAYLGIFALLGWMFFIDKICFLKTGGTKDE